ncbi:MAG TPA: rod shape-determining protein MreC [Capsulimonadaceae bacterium]|jgi:rod shape-determining protein MreC
MIRTTPKDRTYQTLAISLALCAVFTFLQRRAESRGSEDSVTRVVRSAVLAPASHAGHAVGIYAESSLIAPFEAGRLARENARLRARISQLTIENQALALQAGESTELRAMIGLQAARAAVLRPGFVVALKPAVTRDNALVQFAGTGVAPIRGVVVSPSGYLVGQVVQTGPVADVLLITDPKSSAGVRVVSNGRPGPARVVLGICQGNRTRELALVDMPADADVQPGDTVVTSGLGSVYPDGVPVGKVTAVRVDAARSLKMATVETPIDFNMLRGVLLRQ